ncbi:MAG: putative metal-binding motif-containing protein, partial [Alphaproteobacteria bacterium]|nr:putative metal-binding motif-containing protein [Alphaproteobacteria bacterium]
MSTPSVLLALVLVGGCRTKGDDSALPGDSVATEDSSGADSDAPIDADGDGVFAEDDCDDADPTVFPGATELCGGVDEDCDGQVDEDAADAATWYGDGDGDGYGDDRVQSLACEAPEGYVAEAGDCE